MASPPVLMPKEVKPEVVAEIPEAKGVEHPVVGAVSIRN